MNARSAGPGSRIPVLGVPIDAISVDQALERIAEWARARQSRMVCFCNVHSVVTASRESDFMHVVAQSDLALPDGLPVAWMVRRLTGRGQERVSGPDVMLAYLDQAAARQEPLFLLGSTEQTLALLRQRLLARWPGLRIVGAHSPPFRALRPEEQDALVEMLRASGARTVWVSLGCPKQEKWMAEHRGRIPAVMLGVGAAFDFHAGVLRRAPGWMRAFGLEWLHRLASEPGRLWRRYLDTNTRFIALAAMQLWRRHR